jgi:hypothetical protein
VSAAAITQGIYDACASLFAGECDALVCLGMPGSMQPDTIVAVATDVRQSITRPTMGTGRSRERAIEVDVTVSVFVPGDEMVQWDASKRLEGMCDRLEDWWRDGDNCHLGVDGDGGWLVRDSWVSDISGPRNGIVRDPASGFVAGRVAEATVVVTALWRRS